MPRPEHRASDADRDRVAEVLREAHAQGRIDTDELAERLDVTYAARTYADLAAVTNDLPPGIDPHPTRQRPAGQWPVPAERAPGGLPAPAPSTGPPAARNAQALRGAWAAWTVAVSVNVVIWLLVSISSGDAVYFWPMWAAGPWGAVLLALTLQHRRRR